uniref:NADP-dependent oxidoreductase domain-containing protein n=1 Tax=Panagrolaimus sp. PS1159 TaxID=55785 RepID=A0AC35GC53_9BILA
MASHTVTTSAGVKMPRFIYGTAWKKDRTTELVVKAVLNGFRGIDTACQPKHYQEDLVGQALLTLQKEHNISRENLFIQTKFTSLDGQDPQRIPYDRNAPLKEQVSQSFAKSLSNLHTDYIDSLVMHGPMRAYDKTLEVWHVFEELHSQGKVKQLGISNFYDPEAVARLYFDAKVKPAVIQNRFYADSGYDILIRKFCKEHNIYYQSFWTLTANPTIINSNAVKKMAEKRGITTSQIFFRFMMDIGVIPLTGTTSETHMKQDLAVLDMPSLSSEEIQIINEMLSDSI